MQGLSREDRILQELEDIAFGSANAMARLRALELLGKTVGLFKPKELPEVERSPEAIRAELYKKLEAILE
jgi:hypothetical protein